MTEPELHQEIERIIQLEREANPRTYNSDDIQGDQCYQAYERINLPGYRWSVEKRIREYNLSRLYSPTASVIDIGSNVGFFVAEFGMHCKSACGVEPNRYLNDVGRLVCNYLSIAEKTQYFDQPFEDFVPSQQYDRILSLASFYTRDEGQRTSAEAFFGKIREMLAPGGMFFYESTSYLNDPDNETYGHYLASREALRVLQDLFRIEESYEAPSGRCMRQFVLAHAD